jgi:hypothetical protein
MVTSPQANTPSMLKFAGAGQGGFKVALLVVVQIRLKNLGVGLVAIGHKTRHRNFTGFVWHFFNPHSFHHVLARISSVRGKTEPQFGIVQHPLLRDAFISFPH